MNDLKNTPCCKRTRQDYKPLGLMKGFYIACAISAFWGILIGMSLTALRG